MSVTQSSQYASSSASVIDEPDSLGRRKLLLVYIHGFMGDESSFRSFPAHVHRLLTVLLQETHAVYSKIYPRYKSKRHISNARDDFSRWLAPHESKQTDVILLGHSMGGLLAAEVVLMPSPYEDEAFKHEILGTLNFDVPFLGMHPGVVSSGLASLFMPGGEAPADKYLVNESMGLNNVRPTVDEDGTINLSPNDGFWQPSEEDQTFNARFNNDVVLPARKFWESVQHFVHKHSSDLTSATTSLLTSHVEFMSAMSNASELRQRYMKIRVLEVEDAAVRKAACKPNVIPPRVRFVNLYTASTGRPKPPKEVVPKPSEDETAANEAVSEVKATASKLHAELKNESDGAQGAVSIHSVTSSEALTEESSSKPKKDRKFCNLPPRDSNGERDPAWVRIFMQDVDEVGAHCGMFFIDDRYEKLVATVAERIEDWVQESMSVRLLHESQQLAAQTT